MAMPKADRPMALSMESRSSLTVNRSVNGPYGWNIKLFFEDTDSAAAVRRRAGALVRQAKKLIEEEELRDQVRATERSRIALARTMRARAQADTKV